MVIQKSFSLFYRYIGLKPDSVNLSKEEIDQIKKFETHGLFDDKSKEIRKKKKSKKSFFLII